MWFWQDDGYALGTGPYNDGPGLGGFFSDLAEHWRGWEGERSWGDIEGLIRIDATHDGRGHISLHFDLQKSLDGEWRTQGTLCGGRAARRPRSSCACVRPRSFRLATDPVVLASAPTDEQQ